MLILIQQWIETNLLPSMYTFIGDLKREVDKKLKQTLSSDLNILKKSLEATSIYSDAFKRLKELISGYTFKDEAEEIHFLKKSNLNSSIGWFIIAKYIILKWIVLMVSNRSANI